MKNAVELPTGDELALLLWLNSIPRVGPAAARVLLKYFPTPHAVFAAKDYRGVPDLRPYVIKELEAAPKSLDHFQREANLIVEQARSAGISIITARSPLYPPQLLEPTSVGPTILYVIGNAEVLSLRGGAMVGTRSPSTEAREKTRQAAASLVGSGYAIFSGMALGIDAEGHTAALKAGGKTIAVLGCGVERVYPKENSELYHQICQSGAVVSEYPPGTPPSPENLRRRNRLIVGLSKFVVVAECPSDSGAMIAARAALQQQRPLFVLSLDQPGFMRQRSGTELLANTGLAARWDGANVDWLAGYCSTYTRPPSAEARLDAALGKPAPKSRNQPKSLAATAEPPRGSETAPDTPSPPQSQASQEAPLPPDVSNSQQQETSDAAAPLPPTPAISAGQRVRHPKFGAGIVKRIIQTPSGFIEIAFDQAGVKKLSLEFASHLEVLPE